MSWSQKYKKSINCNNPKGFSQKAHCAGRTKKETIMNLQTLVKETIKEVMTERKLNMFFEENKPTNPSKWSYYKSQAKQKFDVYPSAYANGWASKQYKAAGGGWKQCAGESMENTNENFAVHMMVAKAIADQKVKNPETKKDVSVTTALKDKQHPAHGKAKSLVQRLKDKFSKKESIDEKMITPQRGHNYYQLYRDTPIKYVSGHSGIGLKVPGVLLHNEYDTIKGKKGAYIIDYFGAHFYVDMKNKFASRIAHPDNREQNKDLRKNMGRTALAPEHKDWKKYMNESVNEGRVEKEVLQKISKFETLLGYITNDDQYKPLVSKVKREIDKLKKQIEKNESVNEAASRTAMEIGGLTGMNKDAIQKFVDDNKLDIEKVYQFVKKGKLADRMKLVSAIAGKPNNPVQKQMVKQFGEGLIKEAKVKLGKDSVNFKVLGDSKGLTLMAATGNDLDGLQDAIENDVDVKEELRKTLEKQLKIPVEVDRGYEGAGFRFNIDFYSLAKKVK